MRLTWPWVSRARLDDAQDRLSDAQEQVEWLRAEIVVRRDGEHRLDRVNAGMTEVAKAPREKVGPMPMDLVKHIKGFSSPALQREARRHAYRRRLKGESWNDILKDVTTPQPTEVMMMAEGAPTGDDER